MVRKMNDVIYLDNAATTKPYNRLDVGYEYRFNHSDIWMNPSSLYSNNLKYIINTCKNIFINNLTSEGQNEYYDMMFTSGATESNNWVLHNIILNNMNKMYTPTIICSPFEHPSIINTLEYYAKKSLVRINYLEVDNDGHVLLDSVDNAIHDCEVPCLVTCMWVNNEIGSIQPIRAISEICKEWDVPFHVDATQAVGKIDLLHQCDGITSMSFSGHKFHGPKNIGGLLIKKDFLSEIGPFIIGGHQQEGYRAGTENADIIKWFMHSFLSAQEEVNELCNYSVLIHDFFETEIKKLFSEDDFRINSKDKTVPIINISFKDISGEYIVKELAKENIYISTGSACSTGDLAVSDTIKAINVPKNYQEGTIRISFDYNTRKSDIITLINKIFKIFHN